IHPVLSIVTIVLVIITYLQSLAESIESYSFINQSVATNGILKNELLDLIPLLIAVCAVIFAVDATFFILAKMMGFLFIFQCITLCILLLVFRDNVGRGAPFFNFEKLRKYWLLHFTKPMNNAHGPYFFFFEHYGSTIRSPTFINNQLVNLLGLEWWFALAESGLYYSVWPKHGVNPCLYLYSTAIPQIKEVWKFTPDIVIRQLQNINYFFLIGACLSPFIIAVYNLKVAVEQIFCFKNKRWPRMLSFGLLCFLSAWLYLPRYTLLKLKLESFDVLYTKLLQSASIPKEGKYVDFIKLIPWFLLTYAFPCAFKMTTCKRYSSEFIIAGVVMVVCCFMLVKFCFFTDFF
ncbi:hypothetical protein ENBRE01_2469, partial [Enteropsectra breve]